MNRRSQLLRDPRNLALLRLLQGDPRASIADLARGMAMSAPAVRERLLRLKEAGVIAGWRIDIDSQALGYGVCAFVRVRPSPGQVAKVADLAQRLPEVVECHRVTGEDCFILKLHIEALDQLDRVLDQFLAYGQTTSSIVQSTPVPPRPLPLPGA